MSPANSASSLAGIAEHRADADAALRLLFSPVNPDYTVRFAAYLPREITSDLAQRLDETDLQSSLAALAEVEALLRRDYQWRCRAKQADNVSIAFRKIHKRRGARARLDDDIMRTWSDNIVPADRAIISRLRSMLGFRHWLAHGRHWNQGSVYQFQDVYLVANAVIGCLPLKG